MNAHVWEFAAVATGGVGSRFAGACYSGGRIEPWGAVLDLSTTDVADSMPVLLEGSHDAVIGAIMTATNDGRTVQVAGQLHADLDAQAAGVVTKAGRGNIWRMAASVFGATERAILPGRKEIINGRECVGPALALEGGTIRAVALRIVGDDPATAARFFAEGCDPIPHEIKSALILDAERRASAFAVLRGRSR